MDDTDSLLKQKLRNSEAKITGKPSLRNIKMRP